MATGPKFALERVSGAPVSNVEILSDLQRVAALVKTNALSQGLYKQFGSLSTSTATRRFGTWNSAVVAAGLEIANEVNISDERLFQNLILLWEHYGRQPRRSELAFVPSKISFGAYRRRFGTWMDALREFVSYANAHETSVSQPTVIQSGHQTSRDPSLRLRASDGRCESKGLHKSVLR